MRAVKGLLAWAGLDTSEATVFGLGFGFAISLEKGKLSDCLPEHLIIMNAAKALGIECQEFGTVSREKALEHLRDHLGRGTPVAGRLGGEISLFVDASADGVITADTTIPWAELEYKLFTGEGPVKTFLYTYKKTRHIPPLGIATKKALAEMARRFLFPDKPTRGLKAAGMLSGLGKPNWAHEPARGHSFMAAFLEEIGRIEESRLFMEISENLCSASADQAGAFISMDREIFSRFL
ncbi:MAG: hypothetical protein ACP5QG_02325 [candidate division WOR-3 bacterium]